MKIKKKQHIIKYINRGMTHKHLAEKLGLHPITITRWVRELKAEGFEIRNNQGRRSLYK